jgi:hypothetical protein
LGFLEGWSNYHGLETAFTKRMSNRWQAQVTYTVAGFWDATQVPDQFELVNGRLSRRRLGFPVAPDIGGQYTLAATDQRHRAVFNGIWDVGYGFQLSGVYFYGSGQRFSTSYGGDQRNQVFGGTGRLRPDGTIVPRNNLVGNPIHRADLRLAWRSSLGGGRSLQGILDVFNVFNHVNYGAYVTQESSVLYGRPEPSTNIAYQPRTAQLGFRFLF